MRTLASMLRSRTPGSLLKLGVAPAAFLASLVSPSGDSQHHVRLVVVMKTYFNEDGVEMYVPLRPKGFGAPWPEEYLTVAYIRHDRTKLVQVVTILLTIAAVMAVILRLVARRRTKATGWDDYLIVVGLLGSMASTVSIVYATVHAGWGKHEMTLTWDELMNFLELVFVSQLEYLITMLFVKASLLILYRRIFGVSDRFRMVINVTVVIIAIWFIGCLVLTIISVEQLDIVEEEYVVMINGITSSLTDLLILCLPLPMVWRLHARLHTKIKLFFFFSLGTFVCVASLMRVILLARISSLNQTYAAAPIAIWSVVECNLSIIVGSLPIIRSLFASSSSENSHSSRWSGLRQWFTTPSHAASKLSSSGHRASGFRQIWRSEKTQDDSQVDLARGEDGASKNSDSKDAEIAIELTERPNPALAFHDKHG